MLMDSVFKYHVGVFKQFKTRKEDRKLREKRIERREKRRSSFPRSLSPRGKIGERESRFSLYSPLSTDSLRGGTPAKRAVKDTPPGT